VNELPTGCGGSDSKRLLNALLREVGIDSNDYTQRNSFSRFGAILVIAGIIVVVIVRDALAGTNAAQNYRRGERERPFFNQ